MSGWVYVLGACDFSHGVGFVEWIEYRIKRLRFLLVINI